MRQQQRWKTVEYSRTKIVQAGAIVKKKDASEQARTDALEVINNWRAAHAFPLHIIYVHLRRMAKGHTNIIVAERLKRLSSIEDKLKRGDAKNLWTMQDLGGCRFVVPTVNDVYRYADSYDKSRKRHIQVGEDDYIKNPKASGYRSLHRVYSYHSDKNETYNRNMLIEIQFRTFLQHIWATAVETMGVYTHENIKSGYGSEDVNRFFALVSSLFAITEDQPVVPGTSEDIFELVKEIKEINAKNNFLGFLSGINAATLMHRNKVKKNVSYFILTLNYETHKLSITTFRSNEFIKANRVYSLMESAQDHHKKDVVLVQVSSIALLKKAYPNYFADITRFISIVTTLLDRYKGKP